MTLNPADCAIHTRTNLPWSLRECCERYAEAGLGGVSVWRDAYERIGIEEAARIVKGSGLRVPALVRGGFFVALSEGDRRIAIDENLRAIDEASALGAEMVVLVVGARPGVPLADARSMVIAGVGAIAERAQETGVRLAIEPLHPMYAADKSCVSTCADARRVCERIGNQAIGVAVDVYHTWWDADLPTEIARLGEAGRLFGFHVCDWRVETRHMLTDRGLMGDGVIDIPAIRGLMSDAGFSGMIEVEIFSDQYWAMDQAEYLSLILDRLRTHT
ncbi:MAG: sugar phosphate isomerase/epimerase family protein [Planctomycetota bacterium]